MYKEKERERNEIPISSNFGVKIAVGHEFWTIAKDKRKEAKQRALDMLEVCYYYLKLKGYLVSSENIKTGNKIQFVKSSQIRLLLI